MSASVPNTTYGTSTEPKTEAVPYKCRATQTFPLYDRLIPGEPCFLDIEFQKYRPEGSPKQLHRIGRICILNSTGEAVLDTYAIYPREEGQVKCWQPPEFGVVKQDLLFENGGKAAHKVENWVAKIVADRTVVVHGGKQDLCAFYYEQDIWATSKIINTQLVYSGYEGIARPGLKNLTYGILGRIIQEEEHSPFEDNEAMRELYFLKFTYDRDAELNELPASQQRRYANVKVPQATAPAPVRQKINNRDEYKQPQKKNGSAKKKAKKAKEAAAAAATATSMTTTKVTTDNGDREGMVTMQTKLTLIANRD